MKLVQTKNINPQSCKLTTSKLAIDTNIVPITPFLLLANCFLPSNYFKLMVDDKWRLKC